ncbi:MAG: glycosyltransferase family 9 protein [Anaerolineae bacterium]|jgi:hypothetical protein|nr:glycosyltransferase family 9 protein [Anaerolineae bacterium]
MERLKRLFSRKRTQKNGASVPLPPDVAELAATRQAGYLAHFVETELKNDRGSPLVVALQATVETLDWPKVELAKLTARIKRCQQDHQACYTVASEYLETCGFDFELFNFACLALYSASKFEAALSFFKQWQGQLRDEDLTLPLVNAATIIHVAGGDILESKHWLQVGREKYPEDALLCGNTMNIFVELGDRQTVEDIRRTVLDKHRDCAEAMFSIAFCALAEDDYLGGFENYEVRFQMGEVGRYLLSAQMDRERWNGKTPLHGKRLLIHAEQGLGDTVMLSRYLPMLLSQAKEVILECQPEAFPLLAHTFPQIKLLPLNPKTPTNAPSDLWISSMSLPHLFRTTADTVPAKSGYLSVSDEHYAYWREKVANFAPKSRPKIGIAWSGNPTHRSDRRRSISFNRLRPYLSPIDADFFALQTTVPEILPANVINVTEELVTLADTAALIQQMDLVITVDTSIVHVAGAIGHPCWLMLPHRYEWRWGLEGESNNWYDSVKVLRQQAPGAWEPLLEEIFSKRLPAFLATHEVQQ